MGFDEVSPIDMQAKQVYAKQISGGQEHKTTLPTEPYHVSQGIVA